LGTCIHFDSARNWPARSREKADKVSPLKLGPTNTRAWSISKSGKVCSPLPRSGAWLPYQGTDSVKGLKS
jgi:hypothetical protein